MNNPTRRLRCAVLKANRCRKAWSRAICGTCSIRTRCRSTAARTTASSPGRIRAAGHGLLQRLGLQPAAVEAGPGIHALRQLFQGAFGGSFLNHQYRSPRSPGLSGCGQLGGQGPDRPAAKRGSDRHTPAAQAHVPGQRPYRQPAVRPQRALARRLWREYHGAAVLAGVLAQRRRSDAGRSRQPDDHGAARPRQHRRPDDGQGPGLPGTPAAGRPPSIPPPTPAFRPRPTSRRITSPSTTSRAPRPAHRRARRICATAAWATSPRPTNSWPTSRPASCHR